MKHTLKTLLACLVALCVICFAAACNDKAPEKFTVTFVQEGQTDIVKEVTSGEDLTDIPLPVSDRNGYTVAWDVDASAFTKISANVTVRAKYTAIEYVLTFAADEITVGTVTYTVETESIQEPDIPEKQGFTAVWESYDLSVGGNKTVNAVYSPIDYTVKFLNEDGTEISSNTYHYGDTVQVPNDPEKTADNTYTYTFSGWDKEVVTVAGDATYTATFESSYIDYTVKFLNEDGTEISFNTYHYGDTVQVPSDPEKAEDNTYTYAFSGWDKEVVAVVGDATYTATFEKTYIDYTVKFLNEDGTEISSNTYHYGDTVEEPNVPQKQADERYSYTFNGWDKEVTAVVGDATYTATYELKPTEYTVKFLNEDGTEISSSIYHYEDTVQVPNDPEKTADNTYTYTFSGWDKEIIIIVTESVTYTATFEKTYIDYTVKFLNEDGTEISSNTYHYGDTVQVPSDPEKVADNTYTYAFSGWDKEVVAVAGDATYTATFESSYINYTVKFLNEDGTEISSNTYHYGDTVQVPSDPEKAEDNTYTYAFSGWDKEVVAVVGDATYTATFESSYINYTVKFLNEDGTEISSNTYHYGDEVEEPDVPEKADYALFTFKFAGWDKDVAEVTEDANYTATYSSVVKTGYTGNNVSANEEGVILNKGSIGDGAGYIKGDNETGYVHQSYLALDGNYGLDDYIMLDFTGKNMPEIAFFAKNYDDSMWSPDKTSKQGVVVVSGITTWEGEVNTDVNFLSGSTKVDFNSPFMIQSINDGWFRSDGPVEAKLARANLADNTHYRVIMGFSKYDTYGIKLHWYLYNLDTNEVEEQISTIYAYNFFNGSNATVNNMSYSDLVGSIVLYGKFGINCTIDKVWGVFEDTNISEVIGGFNASEKFTVIFNNEDETEIATTQYAFGEQIVFNGEEPVKESDYLYDYEFAGWDKNLGLAYKNVTYTAKFNAISKDGFTVNNVTANGDKVVLGYQGLGTGWNYAGPNGNDAVHQSYLALDGEYGLNNYIVMDFTGKNMPEIAFFAKNYNDSMYYQYGGKQGVVVVSGITFWDGKVNPDVLNGSTYVNFDGALMLQNANSYGFNSGAQNSRKLARANLVDNTHYRVIMGFTANGASAIRLQWCLYNLDTNEVEETVTEIYSWNFFTGSNETVNNMTLNDLVGSIVLYGKFGTNCTIDKIYGVESGSFETIVANYTVTEAE